MKRIGLWALIGLAFTVSMVTYSAQAAAPRTVVLVHGYTGIPGYNYTVYDLMASDLRAAGYNVWQPKLPRSGSSTGDVVKNAEYLKSYIKANNLTDVVLVGHSLGGLEVEYYTRFLNQGEVKGRVYLDSAVNGGPLNDITCWFVPDQCSQAFYTKLNSVDPRTDIPVMNIGGQYVGNDYLHVVDCSITYQAAHDTYPKQQFVRDKVKGFVTLGMC